jgi:hypothetical protein
MTICAKFDGRQVRDCTRGIKNCPCLLEKMQEALAMIGFPKRGTEEENLDDQDMANYVQQNFSRKELGIE